MDYVKEETCEIRHKDLGRQVTEIHDVVYKNGLAASLIRIDERTKSGEKMTKVNTSLILLILVAVLTASGWAFKEAYDLRTFLIGDIVSQGEYCAD